MCRKTFTAIAVLFCSLTVAPSFAQQAYGWTQGHLTMQLPPLSDSFCVLTGVGGKFRGGGEYVHLEATHYEKNPYWTLGGASQQDGVQAQARCFKLSLFSGPTGATDTVRWISYEKKESWQGTTACINNENWGWWGDAMTAISFWGGAYRGGGEYLQVVQSTDPNKETRWYQHVCQDNAYMFGGTYSFFVGKPHSGHPAKFFGPNSSQPGPASTTPEYVAVGNQSVTMARVSDAVCYFSWLGGEFNGGGETATILPEVDPPTPNTHWVLRTVTKSGSGVRARARCFAFAQTN